MSPSTRTRPTRRSLLARLTASALALSALVVAQEQPAPPVASTAPAPLDLPSRSFHSSPFLTPELRIHTAPTEDASTDLFTFIGVRGATAAKLGNFGPYVLDAQGEVVWAGPKGSVLNVGRHIYQGEPVLAYYTGTEEYPGFGRGVYKLYDQSYQHIATVEAAGDLTNLTDPHDFHITPDNTAVIETWIPREMDLSSLGGNKSGQFAFDCVIQEVDIASGELLFQWRSMDHIPVDETFYALIPPAGTEAQPFDAHHLNAVSRDDAGNFLISLRGPSTVYYISRETGEILWRLGGLKSSFKMGEKTDFHFQHHARLHGSGLSSPLRVTLFSNAANQYRVTAHEARGLILELDTDKMEVQLVREYLPSFHLPCSSEGSMQILENGNVVVGWGIRPWFSEYTENGTLVHNVQFGQIDGRAQLDHSYRVYKDSWSGRPLDPPSMVFDASTSSTAFISWNGATDVASYRLYAGATPDTLLPLALPAPSSPDLPTHVARTGFETRLDLPRALGEHNEGRFVVAVACDKHGQPMRSSEILDRKVQLGTGLYADLDALWWAERRRVIELGALSVVILAVLAFVARRRGLFARNSAASYSAYAPLRSTPSGSFSAPSPGMVTPLAEVRPWTPEVKQA
ncbi:hypothetical protein JCM10450v2_001251 [Rhodotorula kratochvilovae]